MQNDQNVPDHSERLEVASNVAETKGPNTDENGQKRQKKTTTAPRSSHEEPFAMVLLPPLQKRQPSGRHSRPLAPPTGSIIQRGSPLPGGARRLAPPQETEPRPPPRAPPRPEHTLSPNSRPIVNRPLRLPPSSHATVREPQTPYLTPPDPPVSPPVMELVSLPLLVTNNNNPAPAPNRKEPNAVSLTSPRPEPEREDNLYTEAPKKLSPALPQTSHNISVISGNRNQQLNGLHPIRSSASLSFPRKNDKGCEHHNNNSKESSSAVINQLLRSDQQSPDVLQRPQVLSPETSIFCQKCGKCKCEACVRPRQLPQKWLCGGNCHLSQTTIVDALSCMCCVKGVFYHCTKDDEGFESNLTNPCSFGVNSDHLMAKVATFAAALPFIPCLMTYPLLKGCAKVTEMVYAECTTSGCQCQKNSSNVVVTDDVISGGKKVMVKEPSGFVDTTKSLNEKIFEPEKGLLITDDPEGKPPVLMPKLIP